MPGPERGYILQYRSLRALAWDHTHYLTHGGVCVVTHGGDCVEPGRDFPGENQTVQLRIATPSGAYFDFPSRIERRMPGAGFLAAFELGAEPSRLALDELVGRQEFQAAVQREPPMEQEARIVLEFDPQKPPAPTRWEPKEEDPAFPTPSRGETYPVYVVTYATVLDYLLDAETLGLTARLALRHANENVAPNTPCAVRIEVPPSIEFRLLAAVESVAADHVVIRARRDDPVCEAACAYPRTTKGQQRRATERQDDRRPVRVLRLTETRRLDDDENMPLRRRLGRMGMEDKINLAMAGEREERMALAQDGNKAIHHYLLRNSFITIDEIAFMARLPSLNPDVLAKIAENPGWIQNAQVLRNLVMNPKTPMRIALRLLDRLPKAEIAMIARRTGMHTRLVRAAQEKLGQR